MQMGQSLTELKIKVLNQIIEDEQLVKAMVIDSESFLDVTPTSQQNDILQSPNILIRTQIMPYKNVTIHTKKDMPYITSTWTGFKKIGNCYKNGTVYFYVLIPNSMENTDQGIRYDFIADRLDSALSSKNNIGDFEFFDRGDIPIDEKTLGHYIAFRILDFYGV